jgi:hypothetical protein
MLNQERFFLEKNLFMTTLKDVINMLNQEKFFFEKNLFIATLKDVIKT